MLGLKNNIFLAPLDNVNCASFRLLCRECGAGLVSTEMINTKAFLNNRKEFYWYKKEHPLLVQFIGSEPKDFKECVKNVNNCDVIDLNAGCPSSDQIKIGNGAALLKNLPLLKEIIKTMVKYSPVPVSVKARMGWKKDESTKIGRLIESAGASFITMHPRTAFQGYGTPADWNVIRDLKKKLGIPVAASGDLLTPKSVSDCFEKTGCDAVMIGRGAMTDPLIFKDSLHYIKKGELLEHSETERLELINHFISLYKKYDKKSYNLSSLRNHCTWLVKGIKGARKLRDDLGRTRTEKELIEKIKTGRV